MNLKKAVNEAYVLNEEKKAIDKKLKPLKESLKKEAVRTKENKLYGTNGRYAHIMPDTTKSCDPQDLLDKLVELDREDEFPGMVKVAISTAEELLGKIVTNEIFDIDYNPYAKVSLKTEKK